jgi:hypothetical protein
LFENFDRSHEEIITKAQFEKIWEDVFRVIVEKLGVLASGRPEENYVNENQLQSYVGNLRNGKK